MLLRTKLITTALAVTTVATTGLSILDFKGAPLEKAVTKNTEINEKAKTALGQAKEIIKKENKKIAGLSGAITTLDNTIDGLEKKIEAAKKSGAADKGTIEDLQSQLDAANKAKQDLQNELDAANKAKQEAEEKAKEANKKAEEAQANLEEAQKKVDEAQKAIDEAKAEGNVDNSELERLEKELADAQANLEKAQKEADAAAIEATDKAEDYYKAYRKEYEQVAIANEFVQKQAKKITDATNSLEKEITSLNDLMNSDKTKNALNTPINNGQTTK